MRPEMPYWYLLDNDMVTGQQCWFCKHENNCNQCKPARSYLKESKYRKKAKRYHGEE